MKTEIMKVCESLIQEDYYDLDQVIAFLCDGIALLQLGFTDNDQDEIEFAYNHYLELRKKLFNL